MIVWDTATRRRIGQSLQADANYDSKLKFNTTGQVLASTGNSGIIFWNLNPESWIEKSCQRAGRNFTREEWAKYFPDEEYRKTCEQWPLEPEIIATPTVSP